MSPGKVEGGKRVCNEILKGFWLFILFKVYGGGGWGTSFSTGKKNPNWISVTIFDSRLKR